MDKDREHHPRRDSPAPPRVEANGQAAGDFAWPPPTEDLEACEIVPLGDDAPSRDALFIGGFPIKEADPRLRCKRPSVFALPVTVGGFPLRVQVPVSLAPSAVPPPLPPPVPIPAPVPEPVAPMATAEPESVELPEPVELPALAEIEETFHPAVLEQPILPAAAPAALENENVFAKTGLWGVKRTRPLTIPVEADELIRETSSIGPRGRAAAALFVAASLALLSWSEFRAQREADCLAAAATPVGTPIATPAPATDAMDAIATAAPEPVRAPAPVQGTVVIIEDPPVLPEPVRREPPPRARTIERDLPQPAPTPVRYASYAVSRDVRVEPRSQPMASPPAPPAIASPQVLQPNATPEVREELAPSRPAPGSVAAPSPVAEPTRASAAPEAPVMVAAVDRTASEEDNVRSTLARWRAAYSRLDARAAKGVYPSIDLRALERAFQGLKSQDVRFDRCELTMRGDGSAQAHCTGRATYVPRVGSQAPITALRAWRFELKRSDQVWTIASARSSI